MASYDIQPLASPHGESELVLTYPVLASSAPVVGEVVDLNASGQVVEASGAIGTGVAASSLLGIAVTPGAQGVGSSTALPNPRTGQAYADNDPVQVLIPSDTVLFKTKNFENGSGNFTDTPTAANIGDTVGISTGGGKWGLDATTTSNKVAEIVDVLDANGVSVTQSGGTGVTVVFRIANHRGNT